MDNTLRGLLGVALLLATVALVMGVRVHGLIRSLKEKVRRRKKSTQKPKVIRQCIVKKIYVPPTIVTPTPPSPSFFLVERTAFVDSKYGDNATAALERPDLPYLTIQAAITAAATAAATDDSPWQVQIRPGIYAEDIVLQPGADLLGITPDAFDQTEVRLTGRIIWNSSDTPAFFELLVQGITVVATDTPALTMLAGSSAITLTCSECEFFSNYSPADSTLFTASAVSAAGSSILILNDCSIAASVSSTLAVSIYEVIPILDSLFETRILQSRIVGFSQTTGAGIGSSIAMEMVRFYWSTDISDFVTQLMSMGNEYATVSLSDTGIVPTVVEAFSLIGTSTGAAITPMTLYSQSDLWTAVSLADEAAPVGYIVSQVGSTATMSTSVQGLMFRTPTASALSALGTILISGTSTACSAYFRGLICNGVAAMLPPSGFTEGSFTLRLVDVLTDLTQDGQLFPGTVSYAQGTANYLVRVSDAMISITDATVLTVTLPDPSLYPGRSVWIKRSISDALSTDVTSTVPAPELPFTLTGFDSILVFSDTNAWRIAAHYDAP